MLQQSIAVLLLSCTTLLAADRPNILFIIADDASRDSMGVYGSIYVKTPNFDRIANEGVLFTNACNCNPKCAPARACLLTECYSWQLEESGEFMGFTGKGQGDRQS